MKRKPSQELMFHEQNSKETIKRLKSPSNKRLPIKKQPQINSIILHKPKPLRYKEDFKVDSNNTTATTKPKPSKSKKLKIKQNSELGQREILDIINLFATKIQRQWRAYSLRKRLHQLVRQSRSTHLKQQSSGKPSQLSFDQAKIKRLTRFIEQDSSEDSPYDKEKYAVQSLKPFREEQSQKIKKSPLKQLNKPSLASLSSKSSNITPRSHIQQLIPIKKTPRQSSELQVQELSKSLEKPYRSNQFQQFPKSKQERRASFNVFQANKIVQNRRHSTGELEPPLREINKKSLQIGRAFDLIIQQPPLSTIARLKSLNSPHSSKKGQKIQSEAAIAFSKVAPLSQLKCKFKKQLQMSKFKQLLSAQNRYKKKQVTYRSYLELVSHIKQEHSTKIKQIIVKESQLKVAWKQLLALYHGSPQDTRFLEDEHQLSSSNMDVSISFERWDFNSSAKKSIEAFELPETNGSKALSIESVLRQLDEEDDVEGKGIQQKNFKRIKSVQVIEAIAQRSKEISDKDIGQYEQLPIENKEENLATKTNQNHLQNAFLENFTPLKILQLQKPLFSQEKRIQKQQKQFSLEFQRDQIKQNDCQEVSQKITPLIKREEQLIPSQSLLISPGTPNTLFNSEDCIANKSQHLIIKQVQSPPTVINIDLNDPLVLKFRELAIERIVMTNIKTINSIKFVCVRAGEELKRKRAAKVKPIPIDSDINGVNTWLLEVSHFILDNYQKAVRDSIVDVKQPSGLDLLGMARKGLDLLPLYQTIPQYIFKDFEFYFIKTQARNSSIPAQCYDRYSTLTYTFHRSLVDSLNMALMDELTTGRDWLYTPWLNNRKFKSKKSCPDQAKLCLERAINVVSNWGEYSLGRMNIQAQVSEVEHRLYQQQKISLVCRQQVLEMSLNHPFSLGYIMLQLGEWIVQQEMRKATQEIATLLL